jgi:O-antigen ligase
MIAVGLFIASFVISTFFGVDAYHSFWDNHERMLGLFTILHYAAFFVVCTGMFKDWSMWRTALRVFLVAGTLVMLVGMLQVLKPDFLLNQGDKRIIGTLGNAIYMGGYGLFLMFAAVLLYLKEEVQAWRISYVVMGILGMLGMFFSGTRGSVLGLAASLLFVGVAYVITLQDRPRVRQGVLAVGAVAVIAVGFLYAYRKTAFVMGLPAVGRAVNTSWTDFKESPRYIAWHIAVKAWQEKPVFGWGPNNYYFAFNKYYNPRSLNFGYGETWFDNAHNIIVNTMAVQGTFGIITYLGIFGTAFWVTLSAYRAKKIDRHVFIIGSGFLVAHLVQNVTVFENITSYLYFFFWLAMLTRLSGTVSADTGASARVVGGGTLGAMSTLIVLLIIIFNVQPARANMKSLATLRLLGSSPAQALSAVQDMYQVNYSPHVDDIRTDIGRSVAGVLSAQGENALDKDVAHAYFLATYDAFKSVIEIHPLDIRVHFMLSQLLQSEALKTQDIRYMQEAERIVQRSLELSPDRQQLLFTLAVLQMQLGKNKEAIEVLLHTKDLNPHVGETYWRLAYAYKLTGDEKKSVAIIKEGREAGANFNDSDERVIAQLATMPVVVQKSVSTTPTTSRKK